MTIKKCSRCKEDKLLDDFAPSKSGKFGVHHYCRDCKWLGNKVSRANKRAMKYGITQKLTLSDVEEVFVDKVCKSCGTFEQLCLDHIVPLALGGANELSNLQALCVKCNNKKGCKMPEEANSLSDNLRSYKHPFRNVHLSKKEYLDHAKQFYMERVFSQVMGVQEFAQK